VGGLHHQGKGRDGGVSGFNAQKSVGRIKRILIKTGFGVLKMRMARRLRVRGGLPPPPPPTKETLYI
jgi:hypothetical protein